MQKRMYRACFGPGRNGMEMVDDMSDATGMAEIIKGIGEWIQTPDGRAKLSEMLRQASHDNEQRRMAVQVDAKMMVEPVTL